MRLMPAQRERRLRRSVCVTSVVEYVVVRAYSCTYNFTSWGCSPPHTHTLWPLRGWRCSPGTGTTWSLYRVCALVLVPVTPAELPGQESLAQRAVQFSSCCTSLEKKQKCCLCLDEPLEHLKQISPKFLIQLRCVSTRRVSVTDVTRRAFRHLHDVLPGNLCDARILFSPTAAEI